MHRHYDRIILLLAAVIGGLFSVHIKLKIQNLNKYYSVNHYKKQSVAIQNLYILNDNHFK